MEDQGKGSAPPSALTPDHSQDFSPPRMGTVQCQHSLGSGETLKAFLSPHGCSPSGRAELLCQPCQGQPEVLLLPQFLQLNRFPLENQKANKVRWGQGSDLWELLGQAFATPCGACCLMWAWGLGKGCKCQGRAGADAQTKRIKVGKERTGEAENCPCCRADCLVASPGPPGTHHTLLFRKEETRARRRIASLTASKVGPGHPAAGLPLPWSAAGPKEKLLFAL